MKNLITKTVVVIITAVILTNYLFSASGTTAVAFLKISPSARASGMAEAFTGVADDSYAIWYNPAGIAKINKLSIGGCYGMMFEGLGFQYVSVVYPLGGKQGVVGGSIMMDDYGSIKGYDSLGNETKSYSAKDTAITAAYAMTIQQGLLVGAAAKLVQSTIESKSNSVVSLDIGVLYIMDVNTTLGLGIKNIMGNLKYDEESVKLPMLIKAGVGYNAGHIASYQDKLVIVADVTNDAEVGTIIQPGVEYTYPMSGTELIIRAGYKTGGGPSGSGLTAGASLKLQQRYRIDVSYTPLGDLGNNIRVGLELQF